jgi:hypothetical protein
VGLLQHLIGFADAGRGTDEDPKLTNAPFFTVRRFKERFR